jgi:hypothetical protein
MSTESADDRLEGLRAGELAGALKGQLFTTDRALWVLVIVVLVVLCAMRTAFRGALGD